MPKQIQTPDGVLHTFPDDATDAEISAVLNESSAVVAPDVLGALRRSLPGLELGIGAAKGAASTATNLGEMALQAPGIGPMLQALNQRLWGLTPDQQTTSFDQARGGLAPTNALQSVGRGAEQIAEYLVPAGAGERAAVGLASRLTPKLAGAARVGSNAALGGTVTQAQGGDASTGAVAGAAGAAVAPAIGAGVRGTGRALRWGAERLGRAGIKPTVSEMKKMPGASITGIDAQARSLVRFILDHRLTSPEKAEKLIREAEQEVQAVMRANPGIATDAPQRAARYLGALRRSAARQGLPEADVRMIAHKQAELLRAGHGEDVTTMVPVPGRILDASGRPTMTMEPRVTRELRASMPAEESLQTARASSRWQTNKQWGEQKGTAKETAKAVERADRDAFKEALPKTKPILKREAMGIRAKKVLNRQAFRESNRDLVGLPTYVAAAGAMAAKDPSKGWLALGAQLLRDKSLHLGVYANDLARAVKRQDPVAVQAVLSKLGVPAVSLATQP